MTGALSLLNAKTRKVLVAQVEDLSAVEFCLVGNSSQAIVVFPDRLVVVKAGTMAGAAFGGRLTEFRYEHIHGIQINTGLVNGTIKIHTAGLGATKAGDFFSSGKEDPFKLPNVIPIAKVNVKHYKPTWSYSGAGLGKLPARPTRGVVQARLISSPSSRNSPA